MDHEMEEEGAPTGKHPYHKKHPKLGKKGAKPMDPAAVLKAAAKDGALGRLGKVLR